MSECQVPISQLEAAFNLLNQRLFSGSLKLPKFVIQCDKKLVVKYDSDFHQMIVGVGIANARIIEIQRSLLHEMVHLANHQIGEVDCTSNQYHNSKFLDKALSVGLYVSRHRTRGWCLTSFSPPSTSHESPSVETINRRQKAIALISFDVDSLQPIRKELRTKTGPKRACFLKYVCGCKPPHNSIRSGRRPDGNNPLSIRCETCGKKFVYSEQ